MDAASEPGLFPEVRLKDLRAGLPPVHVLARVVAVARREVTTRTDGRRRSVLSGLLSDGTATVRFTWWDPPAEGVDRGTVLRAVNAQVREYRERAELSFGWSTKVQPASDLELPALDPGTLPLRHVSDLTAQDDGFRLEVRVVDVAARTVTVGEERRSIHSGHLADGSGVVPFTAWVDFRLKPGDTVRVVGGYVRIFRGLLELTLDERSHIEGIPSATVGEPSASAANPVALGVAESRGTGSAVAVEGLVVGLAAPSGLLRRCPHCARVLREGICPDHRAVPGAADLRARLVLDDGTGVATVNLSREQTELLAGLTLTQAMELTRDGPVERAVESYLRRQLIGRRVRVLGGTRVDDFGLSLTPTQVDLLAADPPAAIDRFARALAERAR